MLHGNNNLNSILDFNVVIGSLIFLSASLIKMLLDLKKIFFCALTEKINDLLAIPDWTPPPESLIGECSCGTCSDS